MTLVVPTTVTRPKLSVSSDLALAWGRVSPGNHALRRSIYPGEHPRGLLLDDCEPVPELGYVTLRAVETSPLPSMLSGSYNNADHWRRVATPATRGAHWYQYTVAAPNQSAGYSRPPWGFYLEPGIMIRFRTYGLPAGQTQSSYVRWQFQDADDSSTWFNIVWMRAYPAASGSDEREGWYITRGSDIIDYCSGGPGLTPGADVTMRVRVIDDYVVITGQGFGSPWVTQLPAGTSDPLKTCLCWCHVKGGMFLWHASPMAYLDTGSVTEAPSAAEGYTAPDHVVSPATSSPSAVATFKAAPGSSGMAASVITNTPYTRLKAVFSGSGQASPKLIALTEKRAPVLASATNSATVLDPAPVACDITLTYEGRGQTCVLTFADEAGANQAALAPGRVVTVSGNYDDGTSAVDLFKGIVVDPIAYSKAKGKLQDYQVGIADAAALLADKKFMLTMGGTFAGQPISDSIEEILAAAGIAAGRINVAADPTNLMPQGRDNLRFAADESMMRALDTLCKARGDWIWFCDNLGDFHAGPRSSFGSSAGTVQDSNVAWLTHIRDITHEQAFAGEYANSVAVLTETRGKPELHVYAPTPSNDDGQDLWHVTQEDCDNGTLRARELADQLASKLEPVSWSQDLDFANLVYPRDTFTTGTIAGIDLASSLTLRVEEVRWHIDAEDDQTPATVTYVARVEVDA